MRRAIVAVLLGGFGAGCISIQVGGGYGYGPPPVMQPLGKPQQPGGVVIPCDVAINCPPVGPGSECIDRGCVNHICVEIPADEGLACMGGTCQSGYCKP